MENNNPTTCDEHVTKLIPWFVTNQLDNEDLHLVSQHLETCNDCNEVVDEERALAAAVRHNCSTKTTVEIPSKWDEFRANILNSDTNNIEVSEHQESDGIINPTPSNVIRFPVLHRAAQKLKQPKTLGYIAMAQAAALVAVISIPNTTSGPTAENSAEYNTLSSGEVNISQQANAIIQVKPGTAIETLEPIFAENNVKIISSTSTSAYLVNISSDNVQDTVVALRQNDKITLAEPIGTE